MGLTNYGERHVLDLMRTNDTLYLGLMTAGADETGGGTEVSGGAYARKAITFSAAQTDGGGVTSMANSAQIEFPTATASWGTVTSWAIFDALSSGNLLWYGDLTVSKEILANDTILLHAGDLVLKAE